MPKAPLKKGDKVRTGFWSDESHIVRKVISCVASWYKPMAEKNVSAVDIKADRLRLFL